MVISNNPDAAGLQLAAERRHSHPLHRPSAILPAARPLTRRWPRKSGRWEVDLVILAGFMRILTPAFIEPFSGRLLNVHPSLLPKYPGLNTHQRALDAGDREAGVTVHFVTLELDGGPPIIQARVPILPGDTAQTLADRVIVQEHRIYPLAAQWAICGAPAAD